MSVLSDTTILEKVENNELVISPFTEQHVQPSSVDLLLSPEFRAFKVLHQPYIDVKTSTLDEITELLVVDEKDGIVIHPGEFILGSTIEHFEIPSNLVARIEGRSSLGRLGIVIHSTAGYIDPGFKGNITLEITNISNIPIRLYPNMRVAQIAFQTLTTPAKNPYGSEILQNKYQGQKGPVASRIQVDFNNQDK